MFDSLAFAKLQFPWFFIAVAFILGACWGSFLNVVIYRVPVGKSVVRPGSFCYGCQKPIAWYDNIPILSWCILRGKSRCCGSSFSPRYAFVEFLTGVLFVLCWQAYHQHLTVVLVGWFFIALLIAGTFIDLDHMILPDFTTVWGALIGVILSFAFPALHGYSGSEFWMIDSMRGLAVSMLGAVVGSGVILWIAMTAETLLKKEAMGFGDVLFMGCIGAFCGWEGALFSIFGGASLGALIVIPLIVLQKLFGFTLTPGKIENPSEDKESSVSGKEDLPPGIEKNSEDTSEQKEENTGMGIGTAIPFGPWLALGALVYFLFLRERVDDYLHGVQSVIFGNLF